MKNRTLETERVAHALSERLKLPLWAEQGKGLCLKDEPKLVDLQDCEPKQDWELLDMALSISGIMKWFTIGVLILQVIEISRLWGSAQG